MAKAIIYLNSGATIETDMRQIIMGKKPGWLKIDHKSNIIWVPDSSIQKIEVQKSSLVIQNSLTPLRRARPLKRTLY